MSVIEEVKDFADDVKKGIGDKGFYLLIAAAGAFGLYNLLKDNNSNEYVSATGYASYPDVGENSEVVIDSLSNEIWASHDEVVGAIESSESEVIQNMDEHFEETNGYIQEGLNNQQEIMDKIEAPRQNSVIEYENTVYFDRNQPTSTSSYTITDKKPEYAVETKTVQIVGKPNTKSTTTKSNKTSTKAATSTKKTTSTTSPSTYNYTTKKGLNTSTSIVDALKATGANSSMEARK